MNTKLIMAVSSVLMAIIGSVLVFFPGYLLKYSDADPNGVFLLILQLLGGLYFAFAMLNWTAKANYKHIPPSETSD